MQHFMTKCIHKHTHTTLIHTHTHTHVETHMHIHKCTVYLSTWLEMFPRSPFRFDLAELHMKLKNYEKAERLLKVVLKDEASKFMFHENDQDNISHMKTWLYYLNRWLYANYSWKRSVFPLTRNSLFQVEDYADLMVEKLFYFDGEILLLISKCK